MNSLRHILMISQQNGAVRMVSLMKPEQQDKLRDIIQGDQAIGITFTCPNLTVLIKCENGSMIALKAPQ